MYLFLDDPKLEADGFVHIGDMLLDEYEYQYYYHNGPWMDKWGRIDELDRFGKRDQRFRWCNNELHYIFEPGYPRKNDVRDALEIFNNEFQDCIQIM